MNKTQRLIVLSLIFILAIACNLPSGAPTEAPLASATPTETPTATATLLPTGTACLPTLTTNTDSNVRGGPGQVYNILGQLTLGTVANVAGKNAEGTWWYIQFPAGPNGHGWIAGSITTANCIPSTLAIIAAPPTPILPSATPTLVPSATPTWGGIIVLPPVFIFPSSTPTPFIFIIPTIWCPFC